MSFSNDQILELLRTHFGMEGAVTRLDGEIDLNFQISTENGRKYTLKIANAAEKTVNLELQGAIMDHLAASGLQLEVPVVVPGKNGRKIQQIDTAGGSRMMRLLTWVEGRCLADVNPHSTELIEQVGALCGKLSRALAGFDHPAAHRFIKWDPSEAA